ncbi:hypothetical protein ABIE49_002645 [Bradyrhizobium sp. OAE829]
MSEELDSKLKTALDESRLLILGAQVLFGFAFQAAFQELFVEVDTAGRIAQIVALALLSISVMLLIVPSLHHQIACDGRTLHSALNVATAFAAWSLLPLTLGLGASAYAVLGRFAGNQTGIIFAGLLTATGLALLYGLGFALRKQRKGLTQADASVLWSACPSGARAERLALYRSCRNGLFSHYPGAAVQQAHQAQSLEIPLFCESEG